VPVDKCGQSGHQASESGTVFKLRCQLQDAIREKEEAQVEADHHGQKEKQAREAARKFKAMFEHEKKDKENMAEELSAHKGTISNLVGEKRDCEVRVSNLMEIVGEGHDENVELAKQMRQRDLDIDTLRSELQDSSCDASVMHAFLFQEANDLKISALDTQTDMQVRFTDQGMLFFNQEKHLSDLGKRLKLVEAEAAQSQVCLPLPPHPAPVEVCPLPVPVSDLPATSQAVTVTAKKTYEELQSEMQEVCSEVASAHTRAESIDGAFCVRVSCTASCYCQVLSPSFFVRLGSLDATRHVSDGRDSSCERMMMCCE